VAGPMHDVAPPSVASFGFHDSRAVTRSLSRGYKMATVVSLAGYRKRRAAERFAAAVRRFLHHGGSKEEAHSVVREAGLTGAPEALARAIREIEDAAKLTIPRAMPPAQIIRLGDVLDHAE
jgi:hypothetical protein